MEMLIVVAIIVMLAGLGSVYLFNVFADSKKSAARVQATTIGKACDLFKLKHDAPPQRLEDLFQNDGVGGPYLDDVSILKDPWGRPYQYDPSGSHHGGLKTDVWSVGPDGQQQIGNWSQ